MDIFGIGRWRCDVSFGVFVCNVTMCESGVLEIGNGRKVGVYVNSYESVIVWQGWLF